MSHCGTQICCRFHSHGLVKEIIRALTPPHNIHILWTDSPHFSRQNHIVSLFDRIQPRRDGSLAFYKHSQFRVNVLILWIQAIKYCCLRRSGSPLGLNICSEGVLLSWAIVSSLKPLSFLSFLFFGDLNPWNTAQKHKNWERRWECAKQLS